MPRRKTNQPTPISSQHQLFVDDYLIQRRRNIARTLHQPRKYAGNPILNNGLLYGSVIWDPEWDCYRMWYQTRRPGPHIPGLVLCHATSQDGLHWEKKNLGLFDVKEVAEGNVVSYVNVILPDFPQRRMVVLEFHSIIRDPDDPDPSRRYKMTFHTVEEDENRKQIRFYFTGSSPDGLRWTGRPDPIYTTRDADISHFMRDSITGKYILWARGQHISPKVRAREGNYYYGRAVFRIESEDFVNWSKRKLVFCADEEDPLGTDIYTLGAFDYEGMYLGLAQMFYSHPDDGLLDIQLTSSRDGWKWQRVANRAIFIPLGEVGEWDRFNQSIAGRPMQVGDELWFYYAGRTSRHFPYIGRDTEGKSGRNNIGVAMLRLDGFVSLDAGFDGGTILTKPLLLKGKALHLNAKADWGEIVVEVCDRKGKPLPGFVSKPVSEDGVDLTVTWPRGKSLARVAGKPVCLKFTLKNAQLYSFWCR